MSLTYRMGDDPYYVSSDYESGHKDASNEARKVIKALLDALYLAAEFDLNAQTHKQLERAIKQGEDF